MAKINILPSKVYNRIAAGEVVDRPCSVVKELVENSIDAGATEIEIRIENGGKQLISVRDNGCGIEREDLPSAFLPHATSKIAKAEDLDNILTLGFRGEAIASISAVSKMTITSKTEKGKCYALSCDGGELGQISETTGEKGAEVCVEALFYHTPVRLGFLKTDKAEEAEITNFVSRFILNRSDIAFTYYANGKKVLQSFGGGDEEAMVSVYGASTLAECFAIDAVKHGIRIRGYLGGQNFFKANKSYQSIFLNGRYILNSTVSAAISNAYASYMMKRQYPFYVLHIDMPTEIVDVNVHPNKADVRFADNQIVYGCIYSVVSAILDGQPKAMEYILKTPQQTIFEEEMLKSEKKAPPPALVAPTKAVGAPTLTYEEAKREIEESAPAFVAKKKGIESPFETETEEEKQEEQESGVLDLPPRAYPKGFFGEGQLTPYDPVVYEMLKKESDEMVKASGYEEKDYLKVFYPDLFFDSYDSSGKVEKAPKKEEAEEDAFEANKRFLNALDMECTQERVDVEGCSYAGKLFNTYLLYERKDTVYIIDQHAAHERLLFDRLKERIRQRKVLRQPMLLPYIMRMNAFESQFMRENMGALNEMGFVIEENPECCFRVIEIPIDLQTIDLTRFLHNILAEINNLRAIKLEDLVKDRLASAACKAAVKAGMDLTVAEIDALFKLMDGDMNLKCPHGRPVVVKMTKQQLEKMFKRIV